MGENGAGKSTLIKALTGVYAIDAGTIVVDGEERRLHGTADAQAAGVAVVYQEVNLCTNLTIGENVMLGHEVRGAVRRSTGAPRTARATERSPSSASSTSTPTRRSPPSRSRCSSSSRSAARWSTDSTVLILDEPTSSLDAAEVEQLFAVIRRLRDEGVAILFVSHFLDQVYAISDRITVLRNGRYVGRVPDHGAARGDLIAKMIGKELEPLASHRCGAPQRAARATQRRSRCSRRRGLGRKGSIAPTDLEMHRGEVVGVAGLLGSGRTELARLLYGADRADSGSLELRGEQVALPSPPAALTHRIAYSTREPPRRGHHRRPDRAREPGPRRAGRARLDASAAAHASRTRSCAKYIAELGHPSAPTPRRPCTNLSGGNQQKVLLGRWLATEPELLILDEPTRGIDVGAKAEIQEAVAELARRRRGGASSSPPSSRRSSGSATASSSSRTAARSARSSTARRHRRRSSTSSPPVGVRPSDERRERRRGMNTEREHRADRSSHAVAAQPWFWGVVAIVVLLCINLIKDPATSRSGSTRQRATSSATWSTSCARRAPIARDRPRHVPRHRDRRHRPLRRLDDGRVRRRRHGVPEQRRRARLGRRSARRHRPRRSRSAPLLGAVNGVLVVGGRAAAVHHDARDDARRARPGEGHHVGQNTDRHQRAVPLDRQRLRARPPRGVRDRRRDRRARRPDRPPHGARPDDRVDRHQPRGEPARRHQPRGPS